MQGFKKLTVWEKAHLVVIAKYQITSKFPKDELYGLTSQIPRASVSIPVNIAEGCVKEGSADFGRFLQIAIGSASEMEYYLILVHDLKFLNTDDFLSLDNQTNEVKRMLINLSKKLRT